jgi:hypothetical protein
MNEKIRQRFILFNMYLIIDDQDRKQKESSIIYHQMISKLGKYRKEHEKIHKHFPKLEEN